MYPYTLSKVATVREKYLENEIFFQVREKLGNFVDGQENFERTWKVREKSGDLKINNYGSLQKIYSVQKKKGMYFLMSWSKPISFFIGSYS